MWSDGSGGGGRVQRDEDERFERRDVENVDRMQTLRGFCVGHNAQVVCETGIQSVACRAGSRERHECAHAKLSGYRSVSST